MSKLDTTEFGFFSHTFREDLNRGRIGSGSPLPILELPGWSHRKDSNYTVPDYF